MSAPKTWGELRAVVLYRDKGLCQICKVDEADEVDHIWPRSAGGLDVLENLRAACGPCNKAKGASYDIYEATAEQLRWLHNHNVETLARAEWARDDIRSFIGLFPGIAVLDDCEAKAEEHESPLSLTMHMLTRYKWDTGPFSAVTVEELERNAKGWREGADEDRAKVYAECDAAEAVAAQMRERGFTTLAEYVADEAER